MISKKSNAKCIFLEENSHFHQDRPPPTSHSLFENGPIVDFQIGNGWYKKSRPDLVGAPGRGTWSGHLVGAHATSMSPPGSGGMSSWLPTPHTGNMITLTHSHTTHTHTERHHKNPKDISFGKKNLEFCRIQGF